MKSPPSGGLLSFAGYIRDWAAVFFVCPLPGLSISFLRSSAMTMNCVRGLALGLAFGVGLAGSIASAQVVIGDEKSQPESLTVAPGGTLYVGSASSPFV